MNEFINQLLFGNLFLQPMGHLSDKVVDSFVITVLIAMKKQLQMGYQITN